MLSLYKTYPSLTVQQSGHMCLSIHVVQKIRRESEQGRRRHSSTVLTPTVTNQSLLCICCHQNKRKIRGEADTLGSARLHPVA